MGGLGSGRQCFPEKKCTIEEKYRINTRDVFFKRQTPRFTSVEWHVLGGVLGWHFELNIKGLRLWQGSHKIFIKIDKTPCNFGNERWWFRCPHCMRRVAHLYLHNYVFSCRHCLDLSYRTKQQSAFSRMRTRSNKLAAKVGASCIEDMQRIKGMHQKTYDRLYSLAFDEEVAIFTVILGPKEMQKINAFL